MYYYKNTTDLLLQDEMWTPIQEYESNYEVSNLGRIKSVERVTKQGVKLRNKILRQFFNIDGYLVVNLYKNGKLKQVKVHRMVGISFIPNPENKPEVNHKRGDKEDNRACELEWNTRPENEQHAWDIGLKKPSEYQKERVREANSGGKSHMAKLVLNTYTGIYYDCLNEAAASANLERRYLGLKLLGKAKNNTPFIYV